MKRPNIVFILSDQMQRAVTEADSGCIMPNIQGLRTDGVSFSNAHTVNAICSPSRASLITGVLPHRHGMVDCTHTVPAYRAEFDYTLPTLPQDLNEAGYSLCYFGKWHIERSHELERFGFSTFETEATIPKRKTTPISRLDMKTEGYRDWTVCGVYSESSEVSEEHYLFDRTMEFIEQASTRPEPFCAFVSTYAPHDPYTVPKELYDMYEGVTVPIPASYHDDYHDKPNVYRRIKELWSRLTEHEVKEIIRCYWSYCTLVDLQVGRLIQFLKNRNLYENTLIVFVSDHGDMMGGHGLFAKGVPAFEETYSIPLVMKLPENAYAGMINRVHASSCDLVPTVARAAGLPWAHYTHGKDLMPYIEGKDPSGSSTVAEFFGQRYSYTQRIVWYSSLKYVFNAFDFDELYDLEHDPEELHNLADLESWQDKKRKLTDIMWRHMTDTGDAYLLDSQYLMHRFAPRGPDQGAGDEVFGRYNKSF